MSETVKQPGKFAQKSVSVNKSEKCAQKSVSESVNKSVKCAQKSVNERVCKRHQSVRNSFKF